MHYREITDLALAHGMIDPGGQTPAASMNVAIRQDVKRRDLLGRDQRFRALGRGMYGLAMATDPLGGAIHQKNAEVRGQLRSRLSEIHPRLFEELIGELLSAVGYEDVEVTRYGGDGGIDVRATLTVGGVTRVQTAIQVKRWSRNVSGRTVRELRGALGPHERGLIITLSAFTRDAIADASSETRMPISLVDGERLLDLLIEHDIGIIRRKVTIYELDEEAFSGDDEAGEGREESNEPARLPLPPTPQPAPGVFDVSDGRSRSLWPLPGGRRAWKSSLDRMLRYVAASAPTMTEAVTWMMHEFPQVASAKVVRGYWQVPKSFGLIQTDGERLALTAEGAEYLRETSSALLLETAKRNVLGVREVLEYLGQRPHSSAEVLERLRLEGLVTWETDVQVGYRLIWLENLGVARAQGEDWSLEAPPASPEENPGDSASSVEIAATDRAGSGFTFEDHFADRPAEIVALFAALERGIHEIDAGVERIFRKQYVAFQSGKHTICSVIPQMKRLRLVLPLDPDEIQHPLVRDLRGVGHWGTGEVEVDYRAAEDLPLILSWLRQVAVPG